MDYHKKQLEIKEFERDILLLGFKQRDYNSEDLVKIGRLLGDLNESIEYYKREIKNEENK